MSRLALLCVLALATSCGGASTGGEPTHMPSGKPGDPSPVHGGGDVAAPRAGASDERGSQTTGWQATGDGAGHSRYNLGDGPDAGASPWAQQEADSAPQLPPRRPMNAAARTAYHNGVAASASGNDTAATSAFQQALGADSNAYKAAYNLGVLADRAGQEDRAIQFYRQALRIQPDCAEAIDGVVAIYFRRNDVPSAVAFVEPIARQWARNLDVQASYADVLVHANRFDDAITAARAALHRDERFAPAMLSMVKANLARTPARTELARSVLDQALAIDANNAEAHYINGTMLESDHRLGEAIAEYRRAVDLRPDYPEARQALGLVYLSGGNYDQAVAMFEGVTRLVPSRVAGWLDLGDSYRAAKQWQKAKATFDRAITMQNNLPQAHFNMGLMYMAAGDTFPGMDKLTALQHATQEFNTYRDQAGPSLPHDDPAQGYLQDLAKQIDREQKRLQRDAARAARDAERAARGTDAGAGGGAAHPATAPDAGAAH